MPSGNIKYLRSSSLTWMWKLPRNLNDDGLVLKLQSRAKSGFAFCTPGISTYGLRWQFFDPTQSCSPLKYISTGNFNITNRIYSHIGNSPLVKYYYRWTYIIVTYPFGIRTFSRPLPSPSKPSSLQASTDLQVNLPNLRYSWSCPLWVRWIIIPDIHAVSSV